MNALPHGLGGLPLPPMFAAWKLGTIVVVGAASVGQIIAGTAAGYAIGYWATTALNHWWNSRTPQTQATNNN
jgi:hypothetical protein